jgi:uncharacterized protein YgiB involved in biofilm formation
MLFQQRLSGDSMKRSRTASLVVMGLTPLFISACDDTSKSQQEFTSVGDCTHANVPTATCETAYNEALVQASRFAPHYRNEALCDAQYEQNTCIEGADNSDNVYWSPIMAGFLIARVIRDGRNAYYPAGPVFRRQDLSDYSPQYGTLYSGSSSSGSSFGFHSTSSGSGGWHSVPSSEVAGEGDTVSRGGFGGGEGEGGHS